MLANALKKAGCAAPVLAPMVVFHPILFSHYTIAQSWPRRDRQLLRQLGHDPRARSRRGVRTGRIVDRGRCGGLMANGELPVINMHNGLGAPLIESLQPGAFYLLNPLLLLFDPNSPTMFDGFALLHVAAFVVGLYFLARTVRASVDRSRRGARGRTHRRHVPAPRHVHYRSVVWLPLALTAAIRFARGIGGRGRSRCSCFAHVAALTAGALQEVFISSLAIACVFAFELNAASAERREKLRRPRAHGLRRRVVDVHRLVSIVPYLKARALGDIFHGGRSRSRDARSRARRDGDAPRPARERFLSVHVRRGAGTWFTTSRRRAPFRADRHRDRVSRAGESAGYSRAASCCASSR
jgi:hypothetical protein